MVYFYSCQNVLENLQRSATSPNFSQKEWDAMVVLAGMSCFVDPPSPSFPPPADPRYDGETKIPNSDCCGGGILECQFKTVVLQRTFKLWRPWEDEAEEIRSPSSGVTVVAEKTHEDREKSSRIKTKKQKSLPKKRNAGFKCDVCEKRFSTRKSWRRHQHQHQRHVRSQTKRRRTRAIHRCPVCAKKFVQKSSVTTHVRIHTGERPFVCDYCSKAFGDFSTYTKHLRVHNGDKPYVCPECHRGFSQSGNLLRHLKRHEK